MDGLFIGEIRDSATRRAALDFAATREPVVTTIHAGGFTDAIIRLINPDGVSDQSALRMSVAQCLHTIIYIDLAFKENGDPHPVIMALPGSQQGVKAAIADGDAKKIGQAINAALTNIREEEGGINPGTAYEVAKDSGATKESIMAAYPPDVRATDPESGLPR